MIMMVVIVVVMLQQQQSGDVYGIWDMVRQHLHWGSRTYGLPGSATLKVLFDDGSLMIVGYRTVILVPK